MKLGKLGVWSMLHPMAPQDVVTTAQKLEALGYSALWLPEALGPDPFVRASFLLSQTKKLILATGIANIYHRLPGVMVAGQKTLAQQSDGRFLLGLGVSHQVLVEGLRGLTYGPPLTAMKTYLNAMDSSPDMQGSEGVDMPRVIAALGPKMLELAASKAMGAHPYFMTPAHTKLARSIMGPDAWLCVEQKVILETDKAKAHAAARATAGFYISLPNYQNGWKFSGIAESEFANGGSDAFIDATFAWGDAAKIKDRIAAHYDAGASHVCIQTVNPDLAKSAELDWKALEAIAS